MIVNLKEIELEFLNRKEQIIGREMCLNSNHAIARTVGKYAFRKDFGRVVRTGYQRYIRTRAISCRVLRRNIH